ncbi:hypothetical protein MGN70_004930 [Eutypa lata]|uniref:Putative c6 zinc finger domain containing protein n=1 Tax=Eutypa lata (strain UCR-EL1) TaxID=1287681 RepID=M7SHZ9_EUTLA|nr:putative c6 zinc finger domain containing protein [Eutypa lata UCREL1]KAI1252726.1 hypothetical protein MGN70_004930 [Eutypa lata]
MTSTQQPEFANSFGTGVAADGSEMTRQRTSSRDYSNTAEWDASKTPPSRFQKRKGSIYATPSSRDGHVERNRDAVEEFHRAHSKRWSISSASSAGDKPAAYGGGDHTAQQQQQQGRKSSVSGGQ